MTWIVLCQEVVSDGRTGEVAAGDLVGIRSDCEIIEFPSLDDAATTLAASAVEVRFEVPDEPGWRRWREMPQLMQAKFRKFYLERRAAALGKTVPVGMVMVNVKSDAEAGWSILFFAKLNDGEHVAPDLDGLADIIAPLGKDITVLPETRREGMHDLPAGWHKLLNRMIDARHITASAIERAQR